MTLSVSWWAFCILKKQFSCKTSKLEAQSYTENLKKHFFKSLAFSNVKYFFIRLSAWSLYNAVWHNFAMCFSKLNLLFMINPTIYTSAESFITFESIDKFYSGRLVLLGIINWNFSGFTFIELILNQVKTFFTS